MSHRLLLFATLLLLPFAVMAQSTIRGVVTDYANGEAIPFASVAIDGTTMGVATDINGVYILNQLSAGRYILRIRCIGYKEQYDTIVLERNKTHRHNIALHTSATTLQTVEVNSTRIEERRVNTQVSVEKITSSQINQMPSIGGSADIAQYLQVLPGISSTGDQGGQLHIRGGSMIQNLCLLDGMIVYNPFHSIGLYSIFETDAILNADIYTGGFGAEYGGRLSSVMDITTRDGNKRFHSGKIGINTFGANVMLEGPLKREKNDSKSTVTYLLSAKNSYLSKSSKTLYPNIEGGLPFDYLDLYGKLTLNAGNGSKASLFGFRFDDSVAHYHDLSSYHWRNYGVGGNFSIVTGSSALLDGSMAYSNYRIALTDQTNLEKYSSISGFNMAFSITNFFGTNRLRYGINMEGYSTDYSYYNAYKQHTKQQENTNAIAAYLTYRWMKSDWIVEPGLRYCYYNSLAESSIEPRLAIKYKLSQQLRLKMAGGLYSQIFLDARSDNDIVNLFSGFLTSVHLNKPATFRGDDATSCIQRSQHLVIGAEYDFTNNITANVEGYIKHFSQLFNANRNHIYDRYDVAYQQNGPYPQPSYLLTDFIVEEGLAYGLDLSLCADLHRLYLWLTYSLARVTRTDELITYTPHYDRRHTLNLLASYDLGSQREWQVSARWSFGSGFAYTQTQGIYELWKPTTINDDYTTNNGTYGIYYADPYQGRLPTYHRLDIGVKRKISLGTRTMLELSAGITNVYNRNNLFYFDRLTLSRINQLPFLATAGIKFTF